MGWEERILHNTIITIHHCYGPANQHSLLWCCSKKIIVWPFTILSSQLIPNFSQFTKHTSVSWGGGTHTMFSTPLPPPAPLQLLGRENTWLGRETYLGVITPSDIGQGKKHAYLCLYPAFRYWGRGEKYHGFSTPSDIRKGGKRTLASQINPGIEHEQLKLYARFSNIYIYMETSTVSHSCLPPPVLWHWIISCVWLTYTTQTNTRGLQLHLAEAIQRQTMYRGNTKQSFTCMTGH